jgi:hypothetical protein
MRERENKEAFNIFIGKLEKNCKNRAFFQCKKIETDAKGEERHLELVKLSNPDYRTFLPSTICTIEQYNKSVAR